MKRLKFLLSVMLLASTQLMAQGVKPLPTLSVEGKWLVDNHGNHVVLHGVMDTPNMYFNGWRWGSPWDGSNTGYNATGAKKCLNYFETLFAGMEEAKCDVFRLHLDPAWTNDPSSSYTYAGSKGQASDASGEADIKKFNPARLKTFLKSLYLPLAQKAMNHGMYVVVRPPGVCPGDLKVGDYYNNYLLTVWDTFSSNDTVKKYAGQISIELANEPVRLKNAQGQDDAKALHDFFQPIVDKIRANGFTGIIWVPGTGWQSSYADYVKYPIEGYNIGYAVHDYCGWYGCSDDKPSPTSKINQFHKQVPVVDTNPIIITEVDWSPKKPGTGHYNEHGDWVESNYGTWATGSTSLWGKAFKTMLDHYGNISMTLSGTGCLIDIDTLLTKKKVVPAFDGLEEACGKACMDWYADYYQVDWPHADNEEQSEESQWAETLTVADEQMEVQVGSSGMARLVATYRDGHQRDVSSMATYTTDGGEVLQIDHGVLRAVGEGTVTVTATYTDALGHELQATFTVRSTFFPFGAQHISTNLFSNGTYDEKTRTFKPGQYGQMGWEFAGGADMSAYKYLVVKLQKASNSAHLNIYTEGSIWSPCHTTSDFGSRTRIVVNLQTAKYTSDGDKKGQLLDTKNIRIVAFWSNYGSIAVDDIYLTNNSDFSPEQPSGIAGVTLNNTEGTSVYTLSGVLVRRADSREAALRSLPAGIYVCGDGKKFVVK